jgi:hypothetical protein
MTSSKSLCRSATNLYKILKDISSVTLSSASYLLRIPLLPNSGLSCFFLHGQTLQRKAEVVNVITSSGGSSCLLRQRFPSSAFRSAAYSISSITSSTSCVPVSCTNSGLLHGQARRGHAQVINVVGNGNGSSILLVRFTLLFERLFLLFRVAFIFCHFCFFPLFVAFLSFCAPIPQSEAARHRVAQSLHQSTRHTARQGRRGRSFQPPPPCTLRTSPQPSPPKADSIHQLHCQHPRQQPLSSLHAFLPVPSASLRAATPQSPAPRAACR